MYEGVKGAGGIQAKMHEWEKDEEPIREIKTNRENNRRSRSSYSYSGIMGSVLAQT